MAKTDFSEIFRALGDGTRYKLMKLLIEKKNICVSELAEEVNISVAGVSQQLKILERAHLIERAREGQKICYQIDTGSPKNQKLLKLIELED